MSRQCREPRRTNAARNNVSNSNNDQTVVKVGGISGNSTREKYATYSQAKVGNTVCNRLLDTESEVTLIPDSIVDKTCIQRPICNGAQKA